MINDQTESYPVSELPDGPEKDAVLSRLVPNLKASYPRIFGEQPLWIGKNDKYGYGYSITASVHALDGKFYLSEIYGGSCSGCDVWKHEEEDFREHVIDTLICFHKYSDAMDFAVRTLRQNNSNSVCRHIEVLKEKARRS